MEDHGVEIKETVSANKKLAADDASELLASADACGVAQYSLSELLASAKQLIAAKGKKVSEFKGADVTSDDAVAAMLGPTGNLRAPTIRVGKTLLVGYDEDTYTGVFG